VFSFQLIILRSRDPTVGLVQSQQAALTTLAHWFTEYLEYDPGAKLSLAAHAERAWAQYLQPRPVRAACSKREGFPNFRGIAEDKIDTSAYGDDKPLEKSTVIELQGKNPDQPAETRVRNFRSTWLA